MTEPTADDIAIARAIGRFLADPEAYPLEERVRWMELALGELGDLGAGQG